jgi:hypothetical protein
MWIYRAVMLVLASPFALAALAEALFDYRHADWPEVPGMAHVRYAPVRRWNPPPIRPSPSRSGPVLESRFDMDVRYVVDGRPYWHWRSGLRELPEDPTAIPVFHDPANPARATLDDPRIYSSRLVAIIAAAFLILSLLPRRIVDRLPLTVRFDSDEQRPDGSAR